jgi:hypothetical protein
MKNEQRYCDVCAAPILSFPERMEISESARGVLKLELCRTCAGLLYAEYLEKQNAVKEWTRTNKSNKNEPCEKQSA